MNNWEDIVKAKLEAYDSPLSHESFAEFKTRQSNSSISGSKRSPLLLLLPATAIAAIIAGVLLFIKPDTIIPSPVSGQEQLLTYRPEKQSVEIATDNHEPEVIITEKVIQAEVSDNEPASPQEIRPSMPELANKDSVTQNRIIDYEGPSTVFHANKPSIAPYKKVGGAASGIIGLGVFGSLLFRVNTDHTLASHQEFPVFSGITHDDSSIESFTKHYLPIKAAISFRTQISNRLFLSSGLEYSIYLTKIEEKDQTHAVSLNQTIKAHYLGLPVLINWSFASNNYLDAYLGVGLEPDYCIKTIGVNNNGGGLGLSLLFATGIQLNINKRLGLYYEPTICYNVFPNKGTAQSYKNGHPVMFVASCGVRINLK